ncbi:MAG: aldolase/citrate lyase family protein [Arcicella sp.]|nr:aldolase/citrate lyase family protein [Arcicella sp.]
MKQNILKQKWVNKEAVLGVISNSSDPTIAELCGWSGLDFYMIDGEHSPVTTSEVQNVVRACESANTVPLARIRSNDPKLILQFLDAGVMGVMMPGLMNAQDVEVFVKGMKYPPMGERGLGPARAWDYGFGKMPQAEYVNFANEQTLVLPMIEDIRALEYLPEMCKVEGVDGFIIGPRDLSMSMGFMDGPAHDEVKTVIDQIFKIVLEAGLVIGTVAATGDQAKGLIEKGALFCLNSVQGLIKTSALDYLKGATKS